MRPVPAYHRPATLREALDCLASEPSLLVVAGATDVYPAQAQRVGWGAAKLSSNILDLSWITGLRGIADRGDHWWIGATTTWTDIIHAHLPPLFDGLRSAAREIGGVQIQNRGTIAGNLVTASPAGDSIPCLLTLDAEVQLASATGDRTLPLADFNIGYRRTALEPGEIVTGLRVPKQTGHGAFVKLGARRYLVISIVMVAGVFDVDGHGIARSARVAVGACSAVAQRLSGLEQRLVGRRLADVTPEPADLEGLMPIDDIRASGAYRRAAALRLVQDLLAAGNRGTG